MDNSEETLLVPNGSVCELSTSVQRIIGKIEATQLARARQEIADHLKDIPDKINFALNSTRYDYQQGQDVTFTSEKKDRECLIDAISELATSTNTKEEILKFILQWLSKSSQILTDEEAMEEDEEAEKLSTEWIEEVNSKVLTRLASSQSCINRLHILSKALFELQHKHLKSNSKETGSNDTTGKRGREKKIELKLLMHLQDMQPMSTTKMVEPLNGKQLEAAVGEIDVILTDITRYLPCKEVQTIAFRYIGKFIENLHKAFLIRSQEYSEVEKELRKAKSLGSQNADSNLPIELKPLQEHSSALKTRAELAEYHYKEVSSKNQDLENTIKYLRSKIEQLQNGGKVTSEEFPPPADLLVEKKQANKISQSAALVKTSKQKLILAKNLKVKVPSNEEPKNILFGGQDRIAEQRVVSRKNIPFGKPEEEKIAPEVCKKKDLPLVKSTRESISTKLSIVRITPTRSPKLEMILNEAVKRKMTKSNLNSGQRQRTWVQKKEALKSKAQQMVVDLLTDFQTAVLYSLDHGLHSGKDLAPDDIGKMQELLESELKNLYGVIENTIKEISMQKLKEEPIEQPVQDRKPLQENLAERSEEQQTDLNVFAEVLEEISRFRIIQEISLDELSAQVQCFIEETKQDQSLSQKEMHFHEKTLQALDTILAMEKTSSRVGMDQLIRIQEVISNLYSSNSALELYRKKVNLQTECSKNEGIYLPVTPSAITGRTIQPRGEDLQVAEDKKSVEMSYTVNVAYLRATRKILDQAEYDGIISKQLNTIATHLIYKILTSIQLRLAYLFRKYVAFHRIQTFRKYLNSRILDLSNEDKEVPEKLYRFASRLKARLTSTIQHWDTRQQLICQNRQRHLNQMNNLFNQLKHCKGLLLLNPLLAIRPVDTKTQKHCGSLFQPMLAVASEKLCCTRGQGNDMPSTLLRMRNSHLWSTNIVDGSFPIAKKDPGSPILFTETPKLVTMDGKNYFRQIVMKP